MQERGLERPDVFLVIHARPHHEQPGDHDTTRDGRQRAGQDQEFLLHGRPPVSVFDWASGSAGNWRGGGDSWGVAPVE